MGVKHKMSHFLLCNGNSVCDFFKYQIGLYIDILDMRDFRNQIISAEMHLSVYSVL